MKPQDDPVLQRFRAEVGKLYGARLERVVLFGSRARGDAHPDSDYDIALFLNGLDDQWKEIERISDIESDIMVTTGHHIHALPFQQGAYNQRTLFMHELRKDGVDL